MQKARCGSVLGGGHIQDMHVSRDQQAGLPREGACEWAPGACTAALVYLKCAIHFMLGSEYLSIYFVFLKKLCI